jgi:two-component system, chemotaxis family, sensor kinase CheA
MQNVLKDKMNDISLLLMITGESDSVGIELILDLCNEIGKQALNCPGLEEIAIATEKLISQRSSKDIFDLIKHYINSTNVILDQPASSIKPNGAIVQSHNSQNRDASLDRSFLPEYIETHLAHLEELEDWVLKFNTGNLNEESLVQSTKRYIHNLKGDSGSIGLLEMEMACHKIEDMISSVSSDTLSQILIHFKVWALNYMNAYANGTIPSILADAFIIELHAIAQSVVGSTDTPKVNTSSFTNHSSETKASVHTSISSSYLLSGEKDILVEFVGEAEEHLNNLESIILDAEGIYSKEAVDTIFRGVHSIKGGSAYFGIEEMTKCSHILENYLSEVRDGKRTLDECLSTFLLTYIDLQKNVLGRAKTCSAGDGRMTSAKESIDFLINLDLYGRNKTDEIVVASAVATKQSPVLDYETVLLQQPNNEASDKLNIKTYVKVDTTRLDLLIDSIGEMVIYSSMLIKHCRELLPSHENVMDATQRVEKFTRDLQDIGMSMRMIPVKGLFQKMSRLVWDVSKKIGKEVVFSTEGDDTELDRNLIDKLADPLMHMVRNSIDHGIESPQERIAKGKARAGKVTLSAYHAGGSIHIRIEDDGRGLNPDKLLKKAIENGIITDNQKLSNQEIYQLIFAAGFSTAAVVTDISGRGVGMDVVRRNVENLRGRILIDSEVDKGSIFTIEIPLTLAILDGMQIQVGSEIFVIPSLSILEFVRPKLGTISHPLDKGETLKLRDKYIPIYRLSHLFGIDSAYTNPYEATMAIVESNKETVALMVDDILGECSTVIKSLGGIFGNMPGVTGCAIMPGGNIALILDILSLVQLARRDYSFTNYVSELPAVNYAERSH